MSLDFTILNSDRTPDIYVDADLDTHARLLALAVSLHLPLFMSLKDYYEDVTFETDTLDKLLEEISALNSASTDNKNLHSFITRVEQIALEAKRREVALSVLAD